MDLALTPPSDELLNWFETLAATLAADAAGERTRRIARFLDHAEMEARQCHVRSTDFEQRRHAERLAEALAASRRVVAAAWSKQHGREFHAAP